MIFELPEDERLVNALHDCIPSYKQLVESHAIKELVSAVVSAACEAASLEAYGSLASNLQLPDSDVDLCIVFQGVQEEVCTKTWRQNVLRTIGNVLWRVRTIVLSRTYKPILRARVPVISFQHQYTGTVVDINTMTNGRFKAAFLCALLTSEPRLMLLVRIVKAWARANDVNDPKASTLNSYCLTLLSIFHLQHLPRPLLPPVRALLKTGARPMVGKAWPDPELVAHFRPLLLQWQQGREPAAMPSTDDLILSFFVRLAGFCCHRFCGLSDYVTASTWFAAFTRCHTQHPRSGFRRLEWAQPPGDDVHPGSTSMLEMLETLVSVLHTDWPAKVGGGKQDKAVQSAVQRVLRLAEAVLLSAPDAEALQRHAGALDGRYVRGGKARTSPLTPAEAAQGATRCVAALEARVSVMRAVPVARQRRGRRAEDVENGVESCSEAGLAAAVDDRHDVPSEASATAAYTAAESELALTSCSEIMDRFSESMDTDVPAAAEPGARPEPEVAAASDAGLSKSWEEASRAAAECALALASGLNISEGKAPAVETEFEEVRHSPLQHLQYALTVEDPFNDEDNAARTLTDLRRLLVPALVLVVVGGKALEPEESRPSTAEEKANSVACLQKRLADLASFDHPIAPEARRDVAQQAEKWRRLLYPMDDADARAKLQKLYTAAVRQTQKMGVTHVQSLALNDCLLRGGAADPQTAWPALAAPEPARRERVARPSGPAPGKGAPPPGGVWRKLATHHLKSEGSGAQAEQARRAGAPPAQPRLEELRPGADSAAQEQLDGMQAPVAPESRSLRKKGREPKHARKKAGKGGVGEGGALGQGGTQHRSQSGSQSGREGGGGSQAYAPAPEHTQLQGLPAVHAQGFRDAEAARGLKDTRTHPLPQPPRGSGGGGGGNFSTVQEMQPAPVPTKAAAMAAALNINPASQAAPSKAAAMASALDVDPSGSNRTEAAFPAGTSNRRRGRVAPVAPAGAAHAAPLESKAARAAALEALESAAAGAGDSDAVEGSEGCVGAGRQRAGRRKGRTGSGKGKPEVPRRLEAAAVCEGTEGRAHSDGWHGGGHLAWITQLMAREPEPLSDGYLAVEPAGLAAQGARSAVTATGSPAGVFSPCTDDVATGALLRCDLDGVLCPGTRLGAVNWAPHGAGAAWPRGVQGRLVAAQPVCEGREATGPGRSDPAALNPGDAVEAASHGAPDFVQAPGADSAANGLAGENGRVAAAVTGQEAADPAVVDERADEAMPASRGSQRAQAMKSLFPMGFQRGGSDAVPPGLSRGLLHAICGGSGRVTADSTPPASARTASLAESTRQRAMQLISAPADVDAAGQTTITVPEQWISDHKGALLGGLAAALDAPAIPVDTPLESPAVSLNTAAAEAAVEPPVATAAADGGAAPGGAAAVDGGDEDVNQFRDAIVALRDLIRDSSLASDRRLAAGDVPCSGASTSVSVPQRVSLPVAKVLARSIKHAEAGEASAAAARTLLALRSTGSGGAGLKGFAAPTERVRVRLHAAEAAEEASTTAGTCAVRMDVIPVIRSMKNPRLAGAGGSATDAGALGALPGAGSLVGGASLPSQDGTFEQPELVPMLTDGGGSERSVPMLPVRLVSGAGTSGGLDWDQRGRPWVQVELVASGTRVQVQLAVTEAHDDAQVQGVQGDRAGLEGEAAVTRNAPEGATLEAAGSLEAVSGAPSSSAGQAAVTSTVGAMRRMAMQLLANSLKAEFRQDSSKGAPGPIQASVSRTSRHAAAAGHGMEAQRSFEAGGEGMDAAASKAPLQPLASLVQQPSSASSTEGAARSAHVPDEVRQQFREARRSIQSKASTHGPSRGAPSGTPRASVPPTMAQMAPALAKDDGAALESTGSNVATGLVSEGSLASSVGAVHGSMLVGAKSLEGWSSDAAREALAEAGKDLALEVPLTARGAPDGSLPDERVVAPVSVLAAQRREAMKRLEGTLDAEFRPSTPGAPVSIPSHLVRKHRGAMLGALNAAIAAGTGPGESVARQASVPDEVREQFRAAMQALRDNLQAQAPSPLVPMRSVASGAAEAEAALAEAVQLHPEFSGSLAEILVQGLDAEGTTGLLEELAAPVEAAEGLDAGAAGGDGAENAGAGAAEDSVPAAGSGMEPSVLPSDAAAAEASESAAAGAAGGDEAAADGPGSASDDDDDAEDSRAPHPEKPLARFEAFKAGGTAMYGSTSLNLSARAPADDAALFTAGSLGTPVATTVEPAAESGVDAAGLAALPDAGARVPDGNGGELKALANSLTSLISSAGSTERRTAPGSAEGSVVAAGGSTARGDAGDGADGGPKRDGAGDEPPGGDEAPGGAEEWSPVGVSLVALQDGGVACALTVDGLPYQAPERDDDDFRPAEESVATTEPASIVVDTEARDVAGDVQTDPEASEAGPVVVPQPLPDGGDGADGAAAGVGDAAGGGTTAQQLMPSLADVVPPLQMDVALAAAAALKGKFESGVSAAASPADSLRALVSLPPDGEKSLGTDDGTDSSMSLSLRQRQLALQLLAGSLDAGRKHAGKTTIAIPAPWLRKHRAAMLAVVDAVMAEDPGVRRLVRLPVKTEEAKEHFMAEIRRLRGMLYAGAGHGDTGLAVTVPDDMALPLADLLAYSVISSSEALGEEEDGPGCSSQAADTSSSHATPGKENGSGDGATAGASGKLAATPSLVPPRSTAPGEHAPQKTPRSATSSANTTTPQTRPESAAKRRANTPSSSGIPTVSATSAASEAASPASCTSAPCTGSTATSSRIRTPRGPPSAATAAGSARSSGANASATRDGGGRGSAGSAGGASPPSLATAARAERTHRKRDDADTRARPAPKQLVTPRTTRTGAAADTAARPAAAPAQSRHGPPGTGLTAPSAGTVSHRDRAHSAHHPIPHLSSHAKPAAVQSTQRDGGHRGGSGGDTLAGSTPRRSGSASSGAVTRARAPQLTTAARAEASDGRKARQNARREQLLGSVHGAGERPSKEGPGGKRTSSGSTETPRVRATSRKKDSPTHGSFSKPPVVVDFERRMQATRQAHMLFMRKPDRDLDDDDFGRHTTELESLANAIRRTAFSQSLQQRGQGEEGEAAGASADEVSQMLMLIRDKVMAMVSEVADRKRERGEQQRPWV